MPLSTSRLVRRLTHKAFSECDLDADGRLSAAELHVGLLLVYDKLNSKLPAHVKPPLHAEVQALLKRHDLDKDGRLGEEEFACCVQELLGAGERGRFTDSLTFQVAARSLFKLLLLPLAVAAIKRAAREAGGEEVTGKLPDGVLVLAVECAAKLGQVAWLRLADRAETSKEGSAEAP